MDAITAAITAYADARVKEERAFFAERLVNDHDRHKRALAAKDAEIAALKAAATAAAATLPTYAAAAAAPARPLSSTSSVVSDDSPEPPRNEMIPVDGCTLDVMFNKVFPYDYSHVWAMFRQAYNLNPEEFEVRAAHYSTGDALPHMTITRTYPEVGQGGVATGKKCRGSCHVYYRTTPDPRGRMAPRRILSYATMEIDRKICVIARWHEPTY